MTVEANLQEYIISFIMMNICVLACFFFRNAPKESPITWLLILIFSIYPFYDTDYFGFQELFYKGQKDDFKEPFYFYLREYSFGSYSIFRLYIWGTALLLFRQGCKHFKLPCNKALLIFVLFYLTTFSYARASLGMAFYFCGLSVFLCKTKSVKNIGLTLICFLLAFLTHRSMLLLVLLTPLALFKINKVIIAFSILSIPFVIIVTSLLFDKLMFGEVSIGFGEGFDSFNETAQNYVNMGAELDYNWKFLLIRYLRISSYYILYIYLLYKYIKNRVIFGKTVYLFLIMLPIIIVTAILFSFQNLGTMVVGYRFLYMSSIPFVYLLCKVYQGHYISEKVLFLLMVPSILSAEGFIFGKILSLM